MESPRIKPICQQADALLILHRLREAGHVAYFAGGCVRDMLMGLPPKDYDIATDAEPKVVRKLFSNTQAVGAAFGVILVHQGPSIVEVATFRRDGPYSDGRRPDEVRFASAEEDAHRRDFTINGLFLDPVENRVIDYVGGQEDLQARRLRAIGAASQRFEEDHLRLLRAVRFSARFNLTIEAQTDAAIRRAAPRLKGVSPERIADELRMMLTPLTRTRAWPLLWELKLAAVLFRLFPAASPTTPLFLAVAPGEPITFALALATAVLEVRLLNPADAQTLLEKPAARQAVNAMRKTLKISNLESDAMEGTLLGLAPLLRDASPTVATKKRFLAQPTSGLSRQLLAALARCGLLAERAAALASDFAELEKSEFAPLPLISGDDLTAAGLQPGPLFKAILETVYDEQLEGKILSRDQAMEMALKHGAPM